MKQLVIFVFLVSTTLAADRGAEWKATLERVAAYEPGQSRAALTALEDQVRAALPNAAERAALEQRLAAVLSSGATVEGRRFVCRQLALIGSATSVPALAGLLTDADLADMARYALEPIPGPAVDQALLAALPKAGGRQQIGILTSLGVRRATSAVAPLGRLAAGADEAVARAAISALEKIPTTASLDALRAAYPNARESLRAPIAHGALAAAHALLARGERTRAEQVFTEFYQSSQPSSVRAAALRGLLDADPVKHLPLLLATLQSEGDALQSLAADWLRVLRGGNVVAQVVAELPRMPLRVQVLVLKALAARGDKAALPAALSRVASPDDAVAAAACECVGALGGAGQVGLLVDLLGNPGRIASARGALTRLRGTGVDAAILKALEVKPQPLRNELIRLLVARHAVDMVPSLLRMAEAPAGDSSDAVFQALGALAGESHLPALVNLAVQARDPAACDRAEHALTELVMRLEDAGKWARAILGQYPKAAAPARCALLRVLRFSGDPRALALVREEFKSIDEAVSEAAFRALADWPNAEPANDLLQVTRASTNLTRRLLAFRGAVRMGGLTAAAPGGPGVKLLRSAMDAAPRVEDKRLVLGALTSGSGTEALQIAQSCLQDPKLVNEASAAVLKIAESISQRQPELARKAVEQVLVLTSNAKLKKQAQALLGKLGSTNRK